MLIDPTVEILNENINFIRSKPKWEENLSAQRAISWVSNLLPIWYHSSFIHKSSEIFNFVGLISQLSWSYKKCERTLPYPDRSSKATFVWHIDCPTCTATHHHSLHDLLSRASANRIFTCQLIEKPRIYI